MLINETGVLLPSKNYFHVPSPRARELFFYPKCIGHYYCNHEYRVERANYDSFLLLYVIRGCGMADTGETGGHPITLTQGAMACIDCYRPHKYYTENGWEIFWLHFDGPLARGYYEAIAKTHSPAVYADTDLKAKNLLDQIYDYYDHHSRQINEAEISCLIAGILTLLLNRQESPSSLRQNPSPLKDTLHFIAQHIDDELSVPLLAGRIFLSKYYFIRLFKKETGYTPHEYILMTRVNTAAHALKTTTASVKDIALRYGFSSESSFCTAFKKLMGYSPRAYRNL